MLKQTHFSFRCGRSEYTKKKRGGGTILFVPKKYNPKIRDDLNFFRPSHFEGSWIEYSPQHGKEKKRELLCLAYNPNKQFLDTFLEDLLHGLDYAASEGKRVTLMGDFNMNYLNNREKRKIQDTFAPYSLSVANKSIPTRYNKAGGSLIDFIISEKKVIKKTLICDAPFATDHNITLLVTNTERTMKQKAVPNLVFNKENYSCNRFRSDLERAPWFLMYSKKSSCRVFQKFEDIFSHCLQKHAPLELRFKKQTKLSIPLPAKSAEYENLRKDKEIKRKTFIDNKCEQTFLSYKRARNTCNNYLKSLRIKSSQEHFSILDTPSKRWKFINSLRNSFNVEASIGILKNALGDLVTEPKKIVNLLNYRFTTLGDYKGESNELYYANIASENHSIFNFRFVTQREVRDTILKLSVNKPLGPTKIPMWAIKDGMNAILPHLTFAINSSVSDNTFLSKLKTAHVIPIFKKDDPEDPAC